MKSRLNVYYYIITSKQNKKGLCPIYCRITGNKERKKFATGTQCHPKDWNTLDNSIKGDSDETYRNNQYLKSIKNKLENIILEHHLNEMELRPEKLYKLFKGEEKQSYTILDAFQFHNGNIRKQVGKGLTKATLVKYEVIEKHVQSFIKDELKTNDINLSELNLAFIEDFKTYLQVEKNHNPNTINKIMQRVRKVIRYIIKYDWIEKDPFVNYKPMKYHKEVIFLTQKELTTLQAYQFTQERLQQVKDCFIFSCYTGLAYNELSNLRANNIIIDDKDTEWINIKRKKTSKTLIIPLLSKAKEILRKYANNENKLLPVISNQKMNSYLKEIASIIGIDKNLTSHIARKTFASTVLLNNNVPMHIVSELLGHSSVTVTEGHYGKVVKNKLLEEIMRIDK